MEMSSPDEAPVLVLGGGLVGLSAALFLGWRGVPTVLVERHAGSSPHPRAIGYTPRTLELLRAVGLADRVPQAPADFELRRARVESLAGTWFEETPWTPPSSEAPKVERSPCLGAAIAQDRLEPILRERARELGADIRLSTELVDWAQDTTGITARLKRRDGTQSSLRASYMIAADGHDSGVRSKLGIACRGRGHIRTLRSVLFRAPLESYLESGVSQFSIDGPQLRGFLTTYQDGRWVLMVSDDVPADDDALREQIQRAIGRDDLPIELVTTGLWVMSASIADRFGSGRVFLAGDAAHTLPPARGGYGANTGIEDAHNLAWKLAAVLSGTSRSELLETYDAERRPIAWLRHDQIFAREDYRETAEGAARGVEILDDDAIEFGQLYRSGAVLGVDATLPAARRPEDWAGQPGTRAPHVWVRRDGERISTLDLLQRSFVLLTADARWRVATQLARERTGIDVECIALGADIEADPPRALLDALGIEPSGASLVRPDGYIAWRATELPVDAGEALLDALQAVAFATSAAPPRTYESAASERRSPPMPR